MDPYHSITKDHKGTAIFLETTHIKAGFAQAWKYLNLEGFLEKSLKINYALKVLENQAKTLKKTLNASIFVVINTVDRDLNQNKTCAFIWCSNCCSK